MATIDLPSYKDNTALIYYKKKSDDTTLDNNLCNYTMFSKDINSSAISHLKRFSSTRIFVNFDHSIKTSLHKSSKAKEYIQVLGTNEFDAIKVQGFIKELEYLSENNSDRALIYIFDNIDDWHPINDINRFEKLFISLKNLKFNEDIYISLLASTILLRNNPIRKDYFSYVENELSNIYSKDELSKLLIGL